MSKTIQPISGEAVHKICSGQVVLSLAIALKELLENSLDAKATAIDIRLREFGSELIEVVDNGIGIHPDNFEALALKHYTSKLRDFDELVDVETFGFRGEALSSLCAVGELVVVTRHESESCGSKLIFNQMGVLREKTPCPRQVGTTITLTNLFYSLPVRQKEFRRNLKREFTKATHLLSSYCLICTNVKITCVNQTKKAKTTFLCTQNNGTIRENISCVFGSKQLSALLEIIMTKPNEDILEEFKISHQFTNIFKLEGFVSSCEHGSGRSSADRQFFFINSRPCDLSKIVKLTNEIYHRYNSHQYPFVLLNILLPKESVDVNVTPDKRLIFFEHEKSLLATVKSSLIKTFENIPSTFRMNKLVFDFPNKSTNVHKTISSCTLDTYVTQTSKKLNERKRLTEEPLDCPSLKQMKSEGILNFNERAASPHENEENEALEDERREIVPKYFTSPIKQVKSDAVFDVTEKETSPAKSDDDEALQDDSGKIVSEYSTNHESQSSQKLCTRVSNFENNSMELEQNPSRESTDAVLSFSTLSEINSPVRKRSDEASFSSSPQNGLISGDRSSENEEIPVDTENVKNNEKCFSENKVEYNVKESCLDTSLDQIAASLRARRCIEKSRTMVNKFHANIAPDANQVAEEELKKEISKDMFQKMKIIGQFNLGFIVTKLENDLFIVDQHATDEKYNFETLQRTTTLNSQKLVIPQELNLTVTNECVLRDNIDVLRKNGFEFSIDDSAEVTKKVKLTSIPVSYNWQFGKEDVDEMLFMLQDAPHTVCRPTRIRSMFASRACRKSVMIGTPLNVAQMRKLIDNMGCIEQPWNCPHGRPTMRHLINLSLLE